MKINKFITIKDVYLNGLLQLIGKDYFVKNNKVVITPKPEKHDIVCTNYGICEIKMY